MTRERFEEPAGLYFVEPGGSEFFSSGCSLFDCVLGGGWVRKRIINVVGDPSAGKTLLGIEAMANYATTYEDDEVHYREAEAAFDKPYAASIGMPLDRVDFGNEDDPLQTVEDLFDDLMDVRAKKVDALYIVDSLDALGDQAEQKRTNREEKGTYGTGKAKKLSEMFRRENKRLAEYLTIIFISQVRDKIGVTFGQKKSRSGGRALDFYASQVVWLAHLGRLSKTRKKVKRAYGVRIRAKCTKNKVGLPLRECDFPIHFAYGIQDVVAGVEWLISVNRWDELFESKKDAESFIRRLDRMPDDEYDEQRTLVNTTVREVWREVDEAFLPPRRKYR